MKNHFWIVIIFILSGCSSNTVLPPPPVTPTYSPSQVVAETATLAVATSRAETLFSTHTPPPTLNANETSILLKFLSNSLPCQLPCWGGITPGKSTVTEAQTQLSILGNISGYAYFGPASDSWVVGTLYVSYPLNNTVVRIWPSYVALSDNETILNIGVSTQSLPRNPKGLVYGDKEYNALVSAYTMPQIFTTYGLPNLIYARADLYVGEPTAPDYFIIRLLYLDLGIFISYTMPMETKENTFRFCPSESLINLELTPQDIGSNYQEFFRQVGNDEWDSLANTTRDQPVAEALRLTNEEFSQLIISAPETCFESPIDIWPEP